MHLVAAQMKVFRAEFAMRETLGASEVGGSVKKDDVMSATSKGGRDREIWDRISGQLVE